MGNFSTKQEFLFYPSTIHVEEKEKIDAFLALLDESDVKKYLNIKSTYEEFGRPEFNPYAMFATIVYGFAMENATLRNLESSCRNDLRFMYLMEGKTPSHVAFSRFINKVIKPNALAIFCSVVMAIFKALNIDMETCFIDGTKQEAKSNKYKVVWKPITFHLKLSDKIRTLLKLMSLDRGVPLEGIISSQTIAQKLSEAETALGKMEEAKREIFSKQIGSLSEYLAKALDYEEKEEICGENRNSYYKTDHDATAMCLKADYYSGLGSSMHAAYQAQAIVSCGFIVNYYISQDRTDIYTFVPSMERFKSCYGTYPKNIVADAGYGYLENYRFCRLNNMKAFIKYQAWQGESSARNPALYELMTDNTIICLGGKKGYKRKLENVHPRKKESEFFVVEGCRDCEFKPYCRRYMKDKTADSKVFEIVVEFQKEKQKARDLLLSVEGIEMRVNRSCQMEGVFGTLKYNMLYDRFRRTSMESVNVEFMLTSLGLNIRKFLRYYKGEVPVKYWTAPPDTTPQKFKKPSAKRLAKRATKVKTKSANEKLTAKYKYASEKNRKIKIEDKKDSDTS